MSTIADTIHPPQIVTLMSQQEQDLVSGSNTSAVPLPDSPLSSPPDSPRQQYDNNDGDDDHDDVNDNGDDNDDLIALAETHTERGRDIDNKNRNRNSNIVGQRSPSEIDNYLVGRHSHLRLDMEGIGTVDIGKRAPPNFPVETNDNKIIPFDEQNSDVLPPPKPHGGGPFINNSRTSNEADSDVPEDEKKVDETFCSSGANTSGGPVFGEDEEWMVEPDEMEPGRIIRSGSAPTAGAVVARTIRPSSDVRHDNDDDDVDGDLCEPPSLALKSETQIHPISQTTDDNAATEVALEPPSLSLATQNIISKYYPTEKTELVHGRKSVDSNNESFVDENDLSNSPPCCTSNDGVHRASEEQNRLADANVVIDSVDEPKTCHEEAKFGSENFELTVMVLPNGDIDSTNPIITIPTATSSSSIGRTINKELDETLPSNEDALQSDRDRSPDGKADVAPDTTTYDKRITADSHLVSTDGRFMVPKDDEDADDRQGQAEDATLVDERDRKFGNYGPKETILPAEAAENLFNHTLEPRAIDLPGQTKNSAEDASSCREMTPNKDLQSSERSADWLQEELRRRAFVKQEINKAILTFREDEEDDRTSGSSKSIQDPVEVSIESFDRLRDSHSMTDDEVAAIMAEGGKESESLSGSSGSREFVDENHSPLDINYGHDSSSNPHNQFDVDQTEAENLELSDDVVQVEMKKFALETRNFLREDSFAETNIRDPEFSQCRGVKISENPSMDASYQNNTKPLISTDPHAPSVDAVSKDKNLKVTETGFVELEANELPVMIDSLDSVDGIAKGDIMLSLLSENTGREETSVGATWGLRVHGAIWRARLVRRNLTPHNKDDGNTNADWSPSRGRSSLPVDLDCSRVVGGFRTIASTQDSALRHLRHDEVDEAIELVEDIIFAYYSYFEKSLADREQNPDKAGVGTIDFKPYIGTALHNLGVLNLLRGEYREAISYFSRSIENRKARGDGNSDHVSSIVKMAVCRYALNEFAAAHEALEEALFYARNNSRNLEDRLQVAEILNNLGCLAYMCGQPTAANAFYRDSMDVQFSALSDSLYTSISSMGQSISLNISITRANIGFIKLVTKDLSVSITALENALMEQQILLRGAHNTIIATMDHLAVARLLNGNQEQAALMFHRILALQQEEYGVQDRRCHVTVDKIKMVQSQGIQYAVAIKELYSTFQIPEESIPRDQPVSSTDSSFHSQNNRDRPHQTNKMIKALNSIRKKKT